MVEFMSTGIHDWTATGIALPDFVSVLIRGTLQLLLRVDLYEYKMVIS